MRLGNGGKVSGLVQATHSKPPARVWHIAVTYADRPDFVRSLCGFVRGTPEEHKHRSQWDAQHATCSLCRKRAGVSPALPAREEP